MKLVRCNLLRFLNHKIDASIGHFLSNLSSQCPDFMLVGHPPKALMDRHCLNVKKESITVDSSLEGRKYWEGSSINYCLSSSWLILNNMYLFLAVHMVYIHSGLSRTCSQAASMLLLKRFNNGYRHRHRTLAQIHVDCPSCFRSHFLDFHFSCASHTTTVTLGAIQITMALAIGTWKKQPMNLHQNHTNICNSQYSTS